VEVRMPPGMPRLVSACGYPPFTNHVPGFVATLDYIFVSTGPDGFAPASAGDGTGSAEAAAHGDATHAGGGGAEGRGPGGRAPRNVSVGSAAPMPDEEAVRRGGCAGHIPGRLFPSDHVSVACDLELRL
jgi:hypothetical protein